MSNVNKLSCYSSNIRYLLVVKVLLCKSSFPDLTYPWTEQNPCPGSGPVSSTLAEGRERRYYDNNYVNRTPVVIFTWSARPPPESFLQILVLIPLSRRLLSSTFFLWGTLIEILCIHLINDRQKDQLRLKTIIRPPCLSDSSCFVFWKTSSLQKGN